MKTIEQRTIERLAKRLKKRDNEIAHLKKQVQFEKEEVQRLGKLLEPSRLAHFSK